MLVSAETASFEVIFKNQNEKTKEYNDKPLSPSHYNFSLIYCLRVQEKSKSLVLDSWINLNLIHS